MDTVEIYNLSKRCENLKEFWKELNGKNITLRLNSSGDDPHIIASLDSKTTKDLSNDLKNIIETQVRKYENEIKQIIIQNDHLPSNRYNNKLIFGLIV